MPSRKKKYNARFPAGRIKKIMQSDEEIGKVAQAVPVIISRTLELFVESLLTKSLRVTNTRNAKTISTSHMKYTIMQESRFDFLRELVKDIADMGVSDDGCNDDSNESPEESTIPTPNINLYSDNPQDQPINLSCNKASTSRSHLNGSSPHTPTATCSSNSRLPSTPSTSVQHQYSPYSSTSPTSSRNSGNFQRNIHHQSSAATDNNENIATMRLKRQWQNVRTMRGQIVENDSAKLLRTNSTPTDLQIPTTPSQKSRGRTRGVGLTHQPRSVPTTPLTPIVRVDFDKEPIIKIDFTNTNLHDNSQSSSASSSLSAAYRRTNQSGPSTAGADLGPVVNIDLSNFAALTTPNNHKIPTVTAVTAAPSTSSILELDEDYDNI